MSSTRRFARLLAVRTSIEPRVRLGQHKPKSRVTEPLERMPLRLGAPDR